MMTNLIASVVIALGTNVTTEFSSHTEPIPCPDGIIGCCVYHCKSVPDNPPLWKAVTTEVVEKEIAAVVWNDDVHNLERSRTLSKQTEYFSMSLSTNWTPMKERPITSPFGTQWMQRTPALSAFGFTNAIGILKTNSP